MTKRPIDDERIAEWVDGELDEIQRSRFEAELRVNPQLRAAAESYRARVMALRAALRGGESLGSEFTDRVMAATVGRREDRRWRILPLLGSALAASLLVGIWFVAQQLNRSAIDGGSVERDSIASAKAARESSPADGDAASGGLELEQAELVERERTDPSLDGSALRAKAERRIGSASDDETKDSRLGFVEGVREANEESTDPGRPAGAEPPDALVPRARYQLDKDAAPGLAGEPRPPGEGEFQRRLRGMLGADRVEGARESQDVFLLGRGNTAGATPDVVFPQVTKEMRGGIESLDLDRLDDARDNVTIAIADLESRVESRTASGSLGALVYLVELPSPRPAGGRADVQRPPLDLGIPLVSQSVVPAPPSEAGGNTAVPEAAGAYVARAGDEVYLLSGDQPQLDAAIVKLAEGVRRLSGRLSVRRWLAPPQAATPSPAVDLGAPVARSRPNESGAAPKDLVERPTPESTWIVIRPLAATGPSPAGPSPSGPATPGPAGTAAPGPSAAPPVTQPPKKRDGETPK